MRTNQQIKSLMLLVVYFLIGIFSILQAQGRGPDSTQIVAFKSFNRGHGFQVYWNTKTGVPEAIFGAKVQQRIRIHGSEGLSPEKVARKFLIQHRDIFKMQTNISDLEISRVRNIKGIAHVRFQQTYNGIPIIGAAYFVHVNNTDKSIHMANGRYFPEVRLANKPEGAITPAMSENVAIEAARTAVKIDNVPLDSVAVRLVIYPKDSSHYLSWEVLVVPQGIHAEWNVYLDAESGDILWKENILRHTNGTGRVYPTDPLSSYQTKTLYRLYSLGHELIGPYVRVENDDGNEAFNANRSFIYSPSNTHFDEVNVYYHADRFAYNFIGFGYSGLPYQIPAFVHSGVNLDDAYFSPTDRELHFGDGNVFFKDLAKKDDVIYHEYTHAITDDIGLAYNINGESAAMNEAYSDYFAATFTNDSIIGEWVTIPEPNLRILNTSASQWNYINYDNLYYNSITNTNSSSNKHYANGMIWSSALWDLRSALNNNNLTDELVCGGLEYANGDATFLQGRAGIIQYDEDFYNGIHVSTIESIFGARGIYPPFSVSISGDGELLEGNTGTWTASVSGGFETGTVSYAWDKKNDGSSQWQPLGSGQTKSVTMGSSSFTLRVTANRGTEYTDNTFYVLRTGGGGGFRITNAEFKGGIPETYSLSQNHPNPFNPTTTIKYDLPEASSVSLVIYDLRGKEVTRWTMANEAAGYKRQTWQGTDKNGKRVPAGMYLLKLTAESKESRQVFTETLKMVLLK